MPGLPSGRVGGGASRALARIRQIAVLPSNRRPYRHERACLRHHGAQRRLGVPAHASAGHCVRRGLRPTHVERPVVEAGHQHVCAFRDYSHWAQHVVPLESGPHLGNSSRAVLFSSRVFRERHLWQHRQRVPQPAWGGSRRFRRYFWHGGSAGHFRLSEKDTGAPANQQEDARQPRQLHLL